jgi:hypothetical protein
VPNVLKLVVSGTLLDASWKNIFHMSWTGATPSSPALLYYLTNYVDTAIGDAYEAEMSTVGTVTNYEVTDLTSDLGASASLDVSHAGLREGAWPPASACVLASLEIARRYRGGHPRIYLPWGTAGTYETGSTKFWDNAFITACNTQFADMIDAMLPGPVGTWTYSVNDLVNVSYYSGGARRTDAVVDQVLSGVVRNRVCSQRRRLGKTGG